MKKEKSAIIATIKKVMPAVVSIVVSKNLQELEKELAKELPRLGPEFHIPEENIDSQGMVKIGGGSGFIVDKEGVVITNRHVVSDPEAEYTVIADNNEKFKAEILGRDSVNDVAVLKIKPPAGGLTTVALGDSTNIELGQTVIAIGNALGLFKNTVSSGIVSGLSRSISAQAEPHSVQELRGLVQTDAAINPGNSGGPLIDVKGKAIGINTAMVFFAENIGFALPINNAKKDLADLKQYGRLRLPFLGIRYVLLDKEVQERFKLSIDHGALVIAEKNPRGQAGAVVLGSTAHQAGIQEGDIILEVQNIKVSAKCPLEDILQKCKIGEDLDLKIFRKGQEIILKVRLDERK